jgi:hypothetical protein
MEQVVSIQPLKKFKVVSLKAGVFFDLEEETLRSQKIADIANAE